MSTDIAFIMRRPAAGTAAGQVWGDLARHLSIPCLPQPIEGGINLYTHGRSHFERPKHEYSAYVGHGVGDKGNWLHHSTRFDTMVVPFPDLVRWHPGSIYGGTPFLDHWLSEGGSLERSRRVLIATSINPMKNKGFQMSTNVDDALDIADRINALGYGARVAGHPAQVGEITPLEYVDEAKVVIADPGSLAYIASSMGKPVIITPGAIPAEGSMEEWMVRRGHWLAPATLDDLDDALRETMQHPLSDEWRLRVIRAYRALHHWPLLRGYTGRWRDDVLPDLRDRARERGLA